MADTSAADPLSRSFLQQLRAGEQHWAWKFALRVIVCIADVIAIGCAAWLLSEARLLDSHFGNPYIGYFEYAWLPASLTGLCVSFTWCTICILVYMVRRPPSPAHPGIAVGIDLILWLGLAVLGLINVAAVIGLSSFGSDSTYLADISYSNSYTGHYRLSGNGTWVYHVTDVYDTCGYSYTTDPNCHYDSATGSYTSSKTASSVDRDCKPFFSSCTEQDAYVNMLWNTKSKRMGMESLVAAMQWLNVLLHFTLFVWACVDTHRKTRGKKTRDTQAVTDRVIRDMQARGLITVHDPAVARSREPELSRAAQGPDRIEEIGQAR